MEGELCTEPVALERWPRIAGEKGDEGGPESGDDMGCWVEIRTRGQHEQVPSWTVLYVLYGFVLLATVYMCMCVCVCVYVRCRTKVLTTFNHKSRSPNATQQIVSSLVANEEIPVKEILRLEVCVSGLLLALVQVCFGLVCLFSALCWHETGLGLALCQQAS